MSYIVTRNGDQVPMTIIALQAVLAEWQQRNFPDTTAEMCFLGIVEEVGELAHANLKKVQGIRGTAAQHDEAAKDAVGDIFVYLNQYCTKRGWNLEDILLEVLTRVLARDWNTNKLNGGDSSVPPQQEDR